MRRAHAFAFSLVLSLAGAAPARAELPPLLPRELLFGNPERTSPLLSPDGKRLGWLAPDEKGVLQVWVKTLGTEDGKVITADKKRGIRSFHWAPDGKTVLYLQDNDGDENFHVFGVDLASGNVRDYTPFQGVRAQIAATESAFPDTILVAMNLRDRRAMDIHRLTLSTGALVLDTENPGDVQYLLADHQLRVRGAQVTNPDGGSELRVRDDGKGPWRKLVSAGPEEILDFEGFTPDGKGLYLSSSLGTDTARLVEKDLASGKEKVLAESKEADLAGVMFHPTRHHPLAASFAPDRERWTVLDPDVKADFAGLAKLDPGDPMFLGGDDAGRTWLVGFQSDVGPVKFYSWDRGAGKATFLFTARPKLETVKLAAMKPVSFKARDGILLHAYLSLPPGVPAKNLPTVLLTHGGPWARDHWGFNGYAQWLANRGYAVLQTNFRSSTGYGKAFLNAGNRQWGKKMHDDLLDAADWAVKQGYSDPKRLAVMGGSYGGYAALAAATVTPEKFACNVDIVGPSNLKTLIASIPPYWKPMRALFDVRMGNVDDPKDAELIREASPLFKADRIKRPLLIGQGQNDPRVNVRESEQIVDAIAKNGGSVTYVLYPDEGHGFARPENSIDFNARTEAFLGKCLGGRVEPLSGERVPGSTAVVRVVGKN
jgi:dipeptidyl aminopeptidase/acylaminoacyl peptidase